MSSIPCDIVILPEPELTRRAQDASAKLLPIGGLFALDDANYYAHASLYMTQLQTSTLDTVGAILEAIAANTISLDLVATRYDQTKGFIDADYDSTDALAQLQMAIIDAINPIRDGMREKDRARMLEATGLARQNFEQYGYKAVGELFRPHMTITRFDSEDVIDTNILPSPDTFCGRFTRLGLFEMGDNGTCVRRIAEFTLSG